jgi:hypothetical protein
MDTLQSYIFRLLLLCRSQYPLTDKNKSRNKTAGDTSQSREIAMGESLYSEVIPTNKRKKRASYSPGDVNDDYSHSEQVKSTGASTEGYTPLWLTGGEGNTMAPPKEELYDEPVSLTAWCWVKTFL